MEQYEGVSILATNLKQNLDDAFLRRLTFSIAFPFPDEHHRRCIWEQIWPKNTPVARDVDAGWLASRFLLSGGNIGVSLAMEQKRTLSNNPFIFSYILRTSERTELTFEYFLGHVKIVPSEYIEVVAPKR
jgi:SpoVK/Ycf46/Vps4 family AAA+-type ATPase